MHYILKYWLQKLLHDHLNSEIAFYKIHFSIDNGILAAILTAILDTEYANIIFLLYD